MNRLLLAALALACACSSALAADILVTNDPNIVLPWGAWLVAILQPVKEALLTTLVGGIGLALTRGYPLLRMFVTDALVESTLRKWLDYGVAEVAGGVQGKTLTVNVGSAALAAALRRGMSRANVNAISAFALKAAGGPEEVGRKLFRMLRIEEGSTIDTVLTPALRDLGLAR